VKRLEEALEAFKRASSRMHTIHPSRPPSTQSVAAISNSTAAGAASVAAAGAAAPCTSRSQNNIGASQNNIGASQNNIGASHTTSTSGMVSGRSDGAGVERAVSGLNDAFQGEFDGRVRGWQGAREASQAQELRDEQEEQDEEEDIQHVEHMRLSYNVEQFLLDVTVALGREPLREPLHEPFSPLQQPLDRTFQSRCAPLALVPAPAPAPAKHLRQPMATATGTARPATTLRGQTCANKGSTTRAPSSSATRDETASSAATGAATASTLGLAGALGTRPSFSATNERNTATSSETTSKVHTRTPRLHPSPTDRYMCVYVCVCVTDAVLSDLLRNLYVLVCAR